MDTGQWAEAKEALKEALEHKPDDAETFANLGLVLMRSEIGPERVWTGVVGKRRTTISVTEGGGNRR